MVTIPYHNVCRIKNRGDRFLTTSECRKHARVAQHTPSHHPLTEPGDCDASANSVSRERPPLRTNLCWRQGRQGSIAEGRIAWRSGPIGTRDDRGVSSRYQGRASNLEIRFCVGASSLFFFFFNQRYRPLANPIVGDGTREREREKRPIARNRRVSRERNAGKHAEDQ